MAIVLRRAILTSLAAFSAGFMMAPTDLDLSDKRPAGTKAQADAESAKLSTEASTLIDELQTIEFTEKAVQGAANNPGLRPDGENVDTQLRNLVKLHDETLAKRRAWDKKVADFHGRLIGTEVLSEQQVYNLYTNDFAGRKYQHFYGEMMAYRDECRLQKGNFDACLTKMEDSETERALRPAAISGAVGGTATVIFHFGAVAFAGARRRRQGQQNKKLLDSTKDLLKPRGL